MILKKKINLSLAVFLILTIFLISFLIYPIYKDIKINSREIILQKEKIASLENEIENLEEFKINYRQIKPNLEKIETLFVNSGAPVGFISFLEKNSKDNKVSIEISPSLTIETTKTPWSSMTLQAKTIGSYSNFLKFLEKLESSHYLIEIQNLSITRLAEAELRTQGFSLGDIKTDFSLKVFTK